MFSRAVILLKYRCQRPYSSSFSFEIVSVLLTFFLNNVTYALLIFFAFAFVFAMKREQVDETKKCKKLQIWNLYVRFTLYRLFVQLWPSPINAQSTRRNLSRNFHHFRSVRDWLQISLRMYSLPLLRSQRQRLKNGTKRLNTGKI